MVWRIMQGFAWGIVLTLLLYTVAKKAFGSEVEVKVHAHEGTGYGRSINNQHYDPLSPDEFTADVYRYMYHEEIPRRERVEDRTHRNDFEDYEYDEGQ